MAVCDQGIDHFEMIARDVYKRQELNAQGVKLILMRCAGYNNVDLETAHKFGMKVLRVPGYSPEAVAEHAMALALTANRHTHKAYILSLIHILYYFGKRDRPDAEISKYSGSTFWK